MNITPSSHFQPDPEDIIIEDEPSSSHKRPFSRSIFSSWNIHFGLYRIEIFVCCIAIVVSILFQHDLVQSLYYGVQWLFYVAVFLRVLMIIGVVMMGTLTAFVSQMFPMVSHWVSRSLFLIMFLLVLFISFVPLGAWLIVENFHDISMIILGVILILIPTLIRGKHGII